jgi:hypothetical protein
MASFTTRVELHAATTQQDYTTLHAAMGAPRILSPDSLRSGECLSLAVGRVQLRGRFDHRPSARLGLRRGEGDRPRVFGPRDRSDSA